MEAWLESGNELGIEWNGSEDVLGALGVDIIDDDVELARTVFCPCIGIGIDHLDPAGCGAQIAWSLFQSAWIEVHGGDFQIG